MNNVKLNIRKATSSDIPHIQRILKVSFDEYATLLGMKSPSFLETEEAIKRDMQQKHVLVATVNQMLLSGTIRYEIINGIGYISRFGVLPNWQSSGTGGQLLGYVERCCKKEGAKALALHTATILYKQMRYYYGQGFYVHSTTQDRGYTRGLLVKPFSEGYDLASIIDTKS